MPGMGDSDSNDRLLSVIRTQTEIAKLGLDLAGVMTLVAQRAQEMTRADGAVVELPEGEDMVYSAATGIGEPHLGLRLMRRNSLSGLCMEANEPLYCRDSELDGRVSREACRLIGLRSMIVVPLRHDDHAVGVLKVLSKRPQAFPYEDLELLAMISELIAASMYHSARLGENELFQQATHDSLTGLPNRALFFERLRLCLAQSQREGHRCGVLALDMDGLKQINDTHGHRAGDAALRELAERLRGVARTADTVARLGGDEFGIILSTVDDRAAAEQAVQRYGSALEGAQVEFEGHLLPIKASIGLAVFADDALELSDLLDFADRAMYDNKKSRKGGGST
jgi:diguanylate cyclase (GGDEF)-like protein